MRVSRIRQWCVAGLMLGMLLGNSAPRAHPHHWIDVFAEWQFDAGGSISGVKLRWLFDDYYSVLLVDEAAATEEELQTVLNKILSNTAKYHYFIWIEHEGGEAKFGVPEQARISVKDHRVEIEFLLPMSKRLNSRHGDIVYRVAEPTYYFEMLHADEGPAIVLKDAPSGCRYHIAAPKPDAALVAYAANLGINESGGDELGIQFAETVTIRCE